MSLSRLISMNAEFAPREDIYRYRREVAYGGRGGMKSGRITRGRGHHRGRITRGRGHHRGGMKSRRITYRGSVRGRDTTRYDTRGSGTRGRGRGYGSRQLLTDLAAEREAQTLRFLLEQTFDNEQQIKNESERVQTKNGELMIENHKLKERLNTLMSENNELMSEIRENNGKKLEIIKTKIRLKWANDALEEKYNELKEENNELKKEYNKLMEECKESKLELMKTKRELKQSRLNVSNYLNWSCSETVDWIITINAGEYALYENHLRLVFAEENVSGSLLADISKTDLKDFGIKNFAKRTNLYKAIQKLVQNDYHQHHDDEGANDSQYVESEKHNTANTYNI